MAQIFAQVHENVLRAYARPLAHMRRQVEQKRFGLVFGSGLSKSFGLPTWSTLVEQIAEDPEVCGTMLLSRLSPRQTLTYKTELLFQHFRAKRLLASGASTTDKAWEFATIAAWMQLVGRHLYRDLPTDIEQALRQHPYLRHYLPLVRTTQMTVTYNFDTLLERALSISRNEGERDQARGFETVTNPWTQFRRTEAVIYHPNGVIPYDLMDTPSDRIVLTESSYADQFMGVISGDYAGLRTHLTKHTCLFIGLSLEDEMLRSLLIQNAQANPGNYHYYIAYFTDEKGRDADHEQAIAQTNFKVYNLITLFAGNAEIAALGQLLNMDRFTEDELCDFAVERGIKMNFRYYVTGALGVGKSTTINQFRNLTVLDEWLEDRPPILGKPWDELSEDEKASADDWIRRQFKLKNDRLRNTRLGVFILDRTPLDPLAFAESDEWSTKASALLDSISPGDSSWYVEDGKVILLEGGAGELANRMLLTARPGYTEEKLRAMGNKFAEIFKNLDGVHRVNTAGLSVNEVTRRVAEIIHLESYSNVCDLQAKLEHCSR